MGTVSRVALVLLRFAQLICGAIVLGILGYFFNLISDAGVIDPNARLIYATVIAALTIIAAIIFMAPFAYSFWAFSIDFLFFVAWLVVFCVLETLTRINTCGSNWYRTYWGFYWGRWYRVASPGVDVMRTGCAAWRTVLAFSFVAMMLYLLSGLLGIYWTLEYGQLKTRSRGFLGRHRSRRDAFKKVAKGTRGTDGAGAGAATPGPTTGNQPVASAQNVPSATVTSATSAMPGTATGAEDVRAPHV